MKYGLLVTGAPYSSPAPHSALRFAHTLLSRGHTLAGVFFYQEGVLNASSLMCPPQDETHLCRAWAALNEEYGVALEVCIAAALRRGVLDEREAHRHGLTQHSMQAPFELTGLGQLLALQQRCDRFITFA
ncbi:sulfurtransferase complex subunit TusD [Halomonas sp. HNIBRBA4712]|uniref:sulfurtransferase complex subunit TusD n=1 Tax=Halomonas sp. HNIBRBA4712 TaxID=3373087 RepID=UPI003746FA7A